MPQQVVLTAWDPGQVLEYLDLQYFNAIYWAMRLSQERESMLNKAL